MPTARELLAQADALMRRSRAGAVDTEVPELSEAMPAATAPPPVPAVLDDVPELTDVVEEIEIASMAELPVDGGVPSEWLHADRDVPSATDAPPQSMPVAEDAVVPSAVASAAADEDWARWQALAEEIRMQVLQRIDIFTDTALREQLGAQLQPIVERAGSEMIATINEQVGTLLRAYIAEAIEREIEKWRKGNS